MKTFYPAIEPNVQDTLPEQDGHTVYYETSGNPAGKPVLFVHGGPGGATQPMYRRFFDPAKYYIVLFDQRGCGRSTPHAGLEANTTWHLVADMERLREKLGINQWMLFGGSWGSTLSLAYAQKHPGRVTELVLRGIFMLRQRELDWFYEGGAARIFPDAWEEYLAPIPEPERGNLIQAYHQRLTGDDAQAQLEAARAWSGFEGALSKLIPSENLKAHYTDDMQALAMARVECHYFVNKGFLGCESQLLDDVDKIRHIPGVIVQGRYDVVCPAETAWALHKRWPEADLKIVPDAGHSATEPGIISELVAATDRFAG